MAQGKLRLKYEKRRYDGGSEIALIEAIERQQAKAAASLDADAAILQLKKPMFEKLAAEKQVDEKQADESKPETKPASDSSLAASADAEALRPAAKEAEDSADAVGHLPDSKDGCGRPTGDANAASDGNWFVLGLLEIGIGLIGMFLLKMAIHMAHTQSHKADKQARSEKTAAPATAEVGRPMPGTLNIALCEQTFADCRALFYKGLRHTTQTPFQALVARCAGKPAIQTA